MALPLLEEIEIILYYQWDIKIQFLHLNASNATNRKTSLREDNTFKNRRYGAKSRN
jgi:hypothetical protein